MRGWRRASSGPGSSGLARGLCKLWRSISTLSFAQCVAGTVARQRYSRFVPRGLTGCALDQGLLGVTGHTRNAEPRFAFALAF